MTLYYCTNCFTVYNWPHTEEEETEEWCFSVPCNDEDKHLMKKVDLRKEAGDTQ